MDIIKTATFTRCAKDYHGHTNGVTRSLVIREQNSLVHPPKTGNTVSGRGKQFAGHSL